MGRLEVDGEEDAAPVIGGHDGREVGRGYALGLGVLAIP